MVVPPSSKGNRGGYESTEAKPFSTAPEFPQQGLVGIFSSASLFLGCSTGLLAGEGRNFSHQPLWAGAFLETISGSRVVLWEGEADHQFLGMETVGKAFLIKTSILEASAEADTRP